MASDPPFHNPFAALKGLVPNDSPSPAPEEPKAAAEPVPAATTTIARAVVRMERAGRGGKEVTVISHLGLSERARVDWLQGLKASLGCGGSVEGDELLLQGDHRERVRAWLAAHGVKKITIG